VSRRTNWWALPMNLGDALALARVPRKKAQEVVNVMAIGTYGLAGAKRWCDLFVQSAMRSYDSTKRVLNK
jgi:hypothetical protein